MNGETFCHLKRSAVRRPAKFQNRKVIATIQKLLMDGSGLLQLWQIFRPSRQLALNSWAFSRQADLIGGRLRHAGNVGCLRT
jgi:hypothetical protein